MSAPALRDTLFVDDALPKRALGAGHPAGLATLRALAKRSERVLVVPTMGSLGAEPRADPLPANERLHSYADYWNTFRAGAMAAVRRDFAPELFEDALAALARGDPDQRVGASRKNSQATPATTSIVAQRIAPT